MSDRDAERERESEIVREARFQRDHERKLAEISRQRDADLARVARDRAQSRHVALGWSLAGILVAAVALAVILAVVRATTEDRRDREQQRVRDAQLAELCVREGNLWVDGDCLIARREEVR